MTDFDVQAAMINTEGSLCRLTLWLPSEEQARTLLEELMRRPEQWRSQQRSDVEGAQMWRNVRHAGHGHAHRGASVQAGFVHSYGSDDYGKFTIPFRYWPYVQARLELPHDRRDLVDLLQHHFRKAIDEFCRIHKLDP